MSICQSNSKKPRLFRCTEILECWMVWIQCCLAGASQVRMRGSQVFQIRTSTEVSFYKSADSSGWGRKLCKNFSENRKTWKHITWLLFSQGRSDQFNMYRSILQLLAQHPAIPPCFSYFCFNSATASWHHGLNLTTGNSWNFDQAWMARLNASLFLLWGPPVNKSEDKAAWPLWPQGARVFHARLLVFHEHAPTPGTKSGSTANGFTPSVPIFRSSRCLASESPSARSKNFKRLSTVTSWSYFRLFRWNSRVQVQCTSTWESRHENIWKLS